MIDNTAPPPDLLISRLRIRSTAMMELISKGLPMMLSNCGFTHESQFAVQEFMNPVVTLIGDLETDVISFVQDEQNALKQAADIVARHAETRTEWKLASQLKDFIREMMPDQREQPKALDHSFVME